MTGQPVTSNLLAVPRAKIEGDPASPAVGSGALDLLAQSAAKDGRVHLLEMTISGYGDDPRELFEIPAVCEWARKAFAEAPGAWYFLSEATQWHFLGWLCGPATKSQVQTREFLQRLDGLRMQATAQGVAEGEALLRHHGADTHVIDSYRAHLLGSSRPDQK
jgi:hypothetical protein